MTRSVKKGPYIDGNLLKKMKNANPGEMIKTWSRDCTVSPEMVGFTFGVHNGREFVSIKIVENMVGHRLGEFSATTKFSRHGGRMQRELEAQAVEKEAAKVQAAEAKPVEKKA